MLRVYEHDPRKVDEVLAFRNAIFNDISKAHWLSMNCTAVVARDDEKLVGFIPLQFREQCLRPGVTIPVVYENAVGVAEGLRGRGIGSQMIKVAAQFIRDRADALMVIRGGERSDGYRFYRKTGHGDVSYMRNYDLPPEVEWPPADSTGISMLDRAQWTAMEAQLLALYDRKYGCFGGGRLRRPGYWDTILDSHVCRGRKWRLTVLQSGEGHLAGYAVIAQGLWNPSDDLYVYEVVGEDDESVERLLRIARQFLTDSRFGVTHVSLANPIRPLLRNLGFVESASSSHVMVRILRPDRIFQRLAAGSDLLDTMSLTVSTPHRTLIVNDPPGKKISVQFETKENLLSRLFCCRLDLDAALDTELVRWDGDDPGLRRELRRVFAFSDWVQWFTDYV